MATESDKVAYGQDCENLSVIPTEDEIVNLTNDLTLVVNDGSELQRVGAIASCNFIDIERHETDFLSRCAGWHQQEKHCRGQGQGPMGILVLHDLASSFLPP